MNTYQTLSQNFLLELTLDNPGSIVATEKMIEHDPDRAYVLFQKMKQIGMTGSKIWCGYKYSSCNAIRFMKNVENLDKAMIKYINEMVELGGCGHSIKINIGNFA
jgi:hypothetical protein